MSCRMEKMCIEHCVIQICIGRHQTRKNHLSKSACSMPKTNVCWGGKTSKRWPRKCKWIPLQLKSERARVTSLHLVSLKKVMRQIMQHCSDSGEKTKNNLREEVQAAKRTRTQATRYVKKALQVQVEEHDEKTIPQHRRNFSTIWSCTWKQRYLSI